MIPFHPLLARDLADQTKIAQSLAPAPAADSKSETDEPAGEERIRIETKPSLRRKVPSPAPVMRHSGPKAKIWRRSRKCRSERSAGRNCSSSRPRPNWHDWKNRPRPIAEQKGQDSASGKDEPQDAAAAKPKPVDPKQIKAGYQKAIELAPRAVEQMERAVKSLKQKDPQAAYPPAEEARKILEEIQKAQPKQDQQDQKQQDQNKKEQKDQTESRIRRINRRKTNRKKSSRKTIKRRRTSRRKIRNRRSRTSQTSPTQQKQDQKQPQPQVSRDQIEEALRKVRERQQEKRERDRKMKARVFGRVPVEKDW